jgi:hypothetical protein
MWINTKKNNDDERGIYDFTYIKIIWN